MFAKSNIQLFQLHLKFLQFFKIVLFWSDRSNVPDRIVKKIDVTNKKLLTIFDEYEKVLWNKYKIENNCGLKLAPPPILSPVLLWTADYLVFLFNEILALLHAL